MNNVCIYVQTDKYFHQSKMPAMIYLCLVWSVVLSVLVLFSSASDPCGYNPTVKIKSGVGLWSKLASVCADGSMESNIDFYGFILCFPKNIHYFSVSYTTTNYALGLQVCTGGKTPP